MPNSNDLQPCPWMYDCQGGEIFSAALRRRRGMTAAQVAESLRVSPASVTRWEQSEQFPTSEHLDILLTLLNTSLEERTTLQDIALRVPVPLADGANCEDECRAYLDSLRLRADQEKNFPGDLCYLAMESHLAQRHARTYVRTLLIQLWTQHAQYLMWQGRLWEMNAYAQRVLDATHPGRVGEECLIQAAGMAAHYLAHGRKKHDFTGAVVYLDGLQELASRYPDGATIFRDMGEYYGLAGQYVEGIRLVRHSYELAERQGDAMACRMARQIEARILVSAGRYEDALLLLPIDDDVIPGMRLFEMLVWVRALFLLGDRSSASFWLERFYTLLETTGLEHMRGHADYLARQL